MPVPPSPTRVLGLFDATSVVIGAIIGVGIFFTPSTTARVAGSGDLSLLAWAVAGAIALCGALTFAELGGLYSSSGAQYEILRDSYGPLPAFLFVFCNSTAIQAGAVAIIAIICTKNLGVAAGGEAPTGNSLLLISAGLVAALMAANIVGVRWGAQIQNLTVVAKILTLLVVAFLAVRAGQHHISEAVLTPDAKGSAPLGGWKGVLAALVPAFFSYGGWQHALWISGEVKNPAKNLPRAIVGGVIVVVAVYVLANWSYLRLLGAEGVAHSPTLAADAVEQAWPAYGRRIIASAVALSAFGVLNAQLLSGPRLVYGMARDNRFFPAFARLSPRFGTPTAGIALIGGMGLVLLMVFVRGPETAADTILNGVVFIDGLFFVLTGAALIILRRKRASAQRPVRVPLYPVIPLLFILGELGVVTGSYLDPDVRRAAYVGVAWIFAAGVAYLVFFRNARGAAEQ